MNRKEKNYFPASAGTSSNISKIPLNISCTTGKMVLATSKAA